jgi:hypothetical protein
VRLAVTQPVSLVVIAVLGIISFVGRPIIMKHLGRSGDS